MSKRRRFNPDLGDSVKLVNTATGEVFTFLCSGIGWHVTKGTSYRFTLSVDFYESELEKPKGVRWVPVALVPKSEAKPAAKRKAKVQP
jgi:hypothetical protein